MAFKKAGRGNFSKPAGRDVRRRERPAPRDYGKPYEKTYERKEPRSRIELFDAVCVKCGRNCQIPFKPTGAKPVYCRQCFNKIEFKSEEPRREYGPSIPSPAESPDLKEINRKLDKIMRALKID